MVQVDILKGCFIFQEKTRVFKNSIIDIGNKRSDLRKFLLATSNYGRTIQENINSVVNKVLLSRQHHLV